MSDRTHVNRTRAPSTASATQQKTTSTANPMAGRATPNSAIGWDFAQTPIHPPGYTPAANASGWRASSDLWYFNGEPGAAHTPTRVTIATDGDRSGDFEWRVREGADKARLVGGETAAGGAKRVNDTRVQLESTAPSLGEDDVVIDATRLARDGTALETRTGRLGVRSPMTARAVSAETVRRSGPGAFPVESETPGGEAGEAPAEQQQATEEQAQATPAAAPHHLTAKGTSDGADGTYGYASRISYEVIDDKGKAIKGFDVNEQWETAVVNDDATCTWRRGAPGGTTASTTQFDDFIQGEASGFTPTATAPGSPLGAHATQHWGQAWYIGSTTPGKGTKVQTNTLQKYLDHARHTGIKSPP